MPGFFLADFLLAFDFEADFFLVTLRLLPFRLLDDLPALAAFFLLDFFLADFAAFFLVFFLVFFLEVFFDDFFLTEVDFFLLAFFLADFFEDLATGRLRERLFAVAFETLFFFAAAFFFGMRKLPGLAPKSSRRLYIDGPVREACQSGFRNTDSQGRFTVPGDCQAGSRCSAMTVV